MVSADIGVENHWHCFILSSHSSCCQPASQHIPINIHLSMMSISKTAPVGNRRKERNLICENGKLPRRWGFGLMETVHGDNIAPCALQFAKNVLVPSMYTQSSLAGIFLLALSPVSISLAYTIFSAYLTFLSKTKINENFSFQKIGADEISLRFWVFFSALSLDWDHSNKNYSPDCWWRDWAMLRSIRRSADAENGKQRNSKGQNVLLSGWRVSRNIVERRCQTFVWYPNQQQPSHDIFPTWTPTAYLTNCTQANLYGENYYLPSIHYNASCLVFGWYYSQRNSKRPK